VDRFARALPARLGFLARQMARLWRWGRLLVMGLTRFLGVGLEPKPASSTVVLARAGLDLMGR
jgi:hypothetical protein